MSNTDLLQTLEDKYGIDGVLRFGAGPGGLLFADIDNAQARASVCLQGAQLTHWQPHAQGAPVLWLSPAARYAPGSAIRGGIPVCWPWFGPAGAGAAAAPDHGFARTRDWVVTDSGQDPDGRTRLCLRLTDSDATRALWPQTFALDLHIAVGATLTLALVTRNTGTAACSITEALHSYFHVGDIGAVRLLGLEGADYTDKATRGARAPERAAALHAGNRSRLRQHGRLHHRGCAAAPTHNDNQVRQRVDRRMEPLGGQGGAPCRPGRGRLAPAAMRRKRQCAVGSAALGARRQPPPRRALPRGRRPGRHCRRRLIGGLEREKPRLRRSFRATVAGAFGPHWRVACRLPAAPWQRKMQRPS